MSPTYGKILSLKAHKQEKEGVLWPRGVGGLPSDKRDDFESICICLAADTLNTLFYQIVCTK